MTEWMEGKGEFSTGGEVWPGAGKVIEEAGELVTVLGKLIQTHGRTRYWDGKPLDVRLVEELGDLYAALDFFVRHNGLNEQAIAERLIAKRALFEKWRSEGDKLP